MSWRGGVVWVSGISSPILQWQPSAGWNKEGGDDRLWGGSEASLKSICVPVSVHKRSALCESSSPSVGGFSSHFPSVCIIPFLRSSAPPYSTDPLLLPVSDDRFFFSLFHFLFPCRFISRLLPPLSPPFVPSSPSQSILSLFIRSPGFSERKWQTSGVVSSSKKPCCWHQCLHGYSVCHTTAGDGSVCGGS